MITQVHKCRVDQFNSHPNWDKSNCLKVLIERSRDRDSYNIVWQGSQNISDSRLKRQSRSNGLTKRRGKFGIVSFIIIYNNLQQHLSQVLLLFRIYSLDRRASMRRYDPTFHKSNEWTVFSTDDSLLLVTEKSNDVRSQIPCFLEQKFTFLGS